MCLLAVACGGSANDEPSLAEAQVPEAVPFASPAADFSSGVSNDGAEPAASEAEMALATYVGAGEAPCGTNWLRLVVPIFALAEVGPSEIVTISVRGGCQSTGSNSTQSVSVLLEPAPTAAVEEVALARGGPESLMGFVELAFTSTPQRVSSSLVHTGRDRLVENRWVALTSTEALRLEVIVDGSANGLRSPLLPEIDALEATAILYQQARNQELYSSAAILARDTNTTAVVAALDEVLARVADTELLGTLATEQGGDAIAFEYAFPENFAAMANVRKPTDCVVSRDRGTCTLAEMGTTYQFTFVHIGGDWLLDDFVLAHSD